MGPKSCGPEVSHQQPRPYINRTIFFSITHLRFPIDVLFKALTDNHVYLRRLCVKGSKIRLATVGPIKEYLDTNERLVFLALFMKECPLDIENLMKEYCNEKRICAAGWCYLEDVDEEIEPGESIIEEVCGLDVHIPYVHKSQMLEGWSGVGTLDIFNGFVKDD